MRLWPVFLLAALGPLAASAQDGAVERGAGLFRQHCATPYCHGPEGTAGRAPRLIGHTHSVNSMFKVITWGIPGTGMPEFTTRLTTEQLADLVAYLMTLRATTPAPAPSPAEAPRPLTPEAKEGRALFFDAPHTGNCGACHELDGWGVPVGPDLAALPPARLANVTHVPASRVGTARPAGEAPFAAILLERSQSRVRVYDLTGPLPVLRFFEPAQFTFDAATSWRHDQVTRVYSAKELEAIGRYLRWQASE